MAERSFSHARIAPGVNKIIWTGLLNGDTGTPYSDLLTVDKEVHVTGTFGAGGSVTVQSDVDTTFANPLTAHDPQGNDLTFTAARLEKVLEPSGVLRPSVTAGDGTTSLTVTLITRQSPNV